MKLEVVVCSLMFAMCVELHLCYLMLELRTKLMYVVFCMIRVLFLEIKL